MRTAFTVSTDENECQRATSPCDENAFCTDTEGSFECACQAGYSGDGLTCEGQHVAAIGFYFEVKILKDPVRRHN